MPEEEEATFELRVSLDGVDPAIWRTFVVPDDIFLDELHVVIQVVMGWTNTHLHEFCQGRRRFGPPGPFGDDLGGKIHAESEWIISDLLKRRGQHLAYEYDFGDGWAHTLTLVAKRPGACETLRVLAGAGACPPEDCGGPFGYAQLLEAFHKPENRNHAERIAWFRETVGSDFDPEAYSIAEVDKTLAVGIDALMEQFDPGDDEWEDAEDAEDEGGPGGDGKIIQFPGTRPRGSR